MIKKLLLTAIIISSASVLYAQKYMTRTGKIIFDATVPKSPEKIEGINNEVASIVDAKTGDLIFQVLIKSFKFERALMQEHFNENYMESTKFPRTDYKGTITNLNQINFAKDGIYNANTAGRITIHGVTKEISVPGTVEVNGKNVRLKAKFPVLLKDYGISVPSVVADKLAKEATVTVDCELKAL